MTNEIDRSGIAFNAHYLYFYLPCTVFRMSSQKFKTNFEIATNITA